MNGNYKKLKLSICRHESSIDLKHENMKNLRDRNTDFWAERRKKAIWMKVDAMNYYFNIIV